MERKLWLNTVRMAACLGLALLLLFAWLQCAALPGRAAQAAASMEDATQISDLIGAYYDAEHDDLVILGRYDPAYPVMSRDQIRQYLATALRARYNGYPTPYPGMTIDFGPKPAPDQLPVFYFGLITDTLTGQSMFGADRLLKVYGQGEDNLHPGTPYTSSVPGYRSMVDRLVDLQDTYAGEVAPQRFYFTPDINLRLTPDQSGVVFSNTQVVLNWAYIPADTTHTSPNSALAAQGFVDHFN